MCKLPHNKLKDIKILKMTGKTYQIYQMLESVRLNKNLPQSKETVDCSSFVLKLRKLKSISSLSAHTKSFRVLKYHFEN